MRAGFKAAIEGWTLISGFAAITDRIEESAKWVAENGGPEAMTPREKATIELMIKCQIARFEQEGTK